MMGSTTGLLNLDQVAELLELPIVLVLKRIDDGRLPHVVVEGRTMSRREHVMALKARQDRQDALMKRLHAELAELELGRPMTVLERVQANAAAIRTMGRRAMRDGFRNGVAAYYMDRERFGDGIVKEHPDGERELIALAGQEEVVIRTLPEAIAEFERPDGTPFEIPRAWWHEC